MKTPLSHDKGVIYGEAVDLVDSHRLDLVVVLLVAGKVSRRASGSECSGQSEDNGSLTLEQVLGAHVLPLEGVGAGQRRVAHTSLECDRRHLVALLERHGQHADAGIPGRRKGGGGEHDGGEDAVAEHGGAGCKRA